MASNGAMTKERFLFDCPSPPHRAVAGALRLALTGDLAPGVEDDCAETDAMAFAEIAQSHYIATALAPAFAENGPIRACFPDDLALFINEMAAANARRNARLREQLEIIGAAFATNGIAAVALKGACELVEPWWSDPGGRYLSDLDLLVSQDDATRAAEILIALGAEQADADASPADHHHLPPHQAPNWEAMVELHIQVGPPNIAVHLPSQEVLANASPSSLPGILLPTPEDRLKHLLLHAPMGGVGVRGGRLYLREVGNIWAAQEHLGLEVSRDVEDQIRTSDAGTGVYPYGSLTDAILGSGERPQSRKARSALQRLGRPREDRLRQSIEWGVYYLGTALADPAKRRQYVEKLLRPGGMKAVRAFHARRRNMTR